MCCGALSRAHDARGRATGAHAQHAKAGPGVQRLSLGRGDASRCRPTEAATAGVAADRRAPARSDTAAGVNPALSHLGLARIREFVGRRSLLAFDIDGTLAPIVARPWDARIPDEIQGRLAATTAIRTVAVITGRAIADAKAMLAFSPRYLIGNHGAEGVPGFEAVSATYARDCSQWLEVLRGETESWRAIPGITLEDKAYSI